MLVNVIKVVFRHVEDESHVEIGEFRAEEVPCVIALAEITPVLLEGHDTCKFYSTQWVPESGVFEILLVNEN